MSNALFENVSALAGQMQDLARQAHAGYAAEVAAVITADMAFMYERAGPGVAC